VGELTEHLRQGNSEDLDARIEALIYAELKRIARNRLGAAGPGVSLQATELAHEGWMRLRHEGYEWKNRAQFFGAVKKTMDRAIIDLVRKQTTEKRNKGCRPDSLEDHQASDGGQAIREMDVAEALEKVRAVDPRASLVLRARLLQGMTLEQIAQGFGEELGVRDPKSLRSLFKRGKTLFISFYQTQ